MSTKAKPYIQANFKFALTKAHFYHEHTHIYIVTLVTALCDNGLKHAAIIIYTHYLVTAFYPVTSVTSVTYVTVVYPVTR